MLAGFGLDTLQRPQLLDQRWLSRIHFDTIAPMSSNRFRSNSILLCLGILLASFACTGKPTASPHPTTPPPQSTISNPQFPLSPTPSPLTPLSHTPLSPTSSPLPPVPQSTISPTPSPLPPVPPSTINNPQYHLSAEFDFYQHSLVVAEIITYTNVTSQTLTDLLLVVPANRWPGAFTLKEIRWTDGEPVQDFALHLHRLTVLFPRPLPPGGRTSFSLSYNLLLPQIPKPSDAAPQPFGFTPAQTNLVDWYAYVPPYRDGWLVHDPGYWGEYQVFDEGDFRLDLTLTNAPQGLAIAASAQPFETVPGEGITYRYQLASARTFALSLSPSYQVFSQTVDLGGSSVEVFSYAFGLDGQAGQAALEETARALKLYAGLFGSYPRATMSVVEADFLDGMEYDGLYFLSKGFYNLYDGTPNGYLTSIAVHETAHQWWYGLVGNDQALDPWLDEALCTFTERVYYEHFYPEALTRWWQPYRVDYYDPRGLIGGSIYDYASYRAYRDAVYLHGQEFLQAARQRLGDQAFFDFLKAYAARYRGRIATAQDFLDLLANYSPDGIEDLVVEYFGK